MATQKERILYDIEHPVGCAGQTIDGLCGSVWLGKYMPRYAARINELRNEGHNIITVGTCKIHKTAVYRLVTEPVQEALL